MMDHDYRAILNEELERLCPGDKVKFTLEVAHQAYGVPTLGQIHGSCVPGTTLKPWAERLLPKGLVATIDPHNDCVVVVRQ